MKKIAFTICAKNYIGLAQTLESSIKLYNKDVEFFIFVADEISLEENIKSLPNNVIIAKDALDIPIDQWYQMCFKYSLLEFCTAIKPSCFKYIFKHLNPQGCIYFDPDILVFNSLIGIYDKLENYSIILTPHITSMEEEYTGKLNEQNLLISGMYNLGFLALKNDEYSSKMLKWWAIRLKDRCYQNVMENYFTDQKWMDFLPSFFPSQLLISFDLGLNLAPWNFFEREIVLEDNSFFVKNRIEKEKITLYPLTFVHFSGFNYNSLINDEISYASVVNDLEIYADLKDLLMVYSSFLKINAFQKYINLEYSYNYFSNHVFISSVYRRLFRRLLEDNKIISNPFNCSEQFYLSLNKNGLIKNGMNKIDKSSILNVTNVENKTLQINKLLYILYRFIGVKKFFQLVRLMRLYSKIENHVFLVDRDYLKRFKIRI